MFNNVFGKTTHKYSTQFSEAKFKYNKLSSSSTKYSIFMREPKITNEFLTKEEKEIKSHSIFLRKFKTKLPENDRKGNIFKQLNTCESLPELEVDCRSGSRTATISSMKIFEEIVNNFYQQTIVTKNSVLDVEKVLGLIIRVFSVLQVLFFKQIVSTMIYFFVFLYNNDIITITFVCQTSLYLFVTVFFENK